MNWGAFVGSLLVLGGSFAYFVVAGLLTTRGVERRLGPVWAASFFLLAVAVYVAIIVGLTTPAGAMQ